MPLSLLSAFKNLDTVIADTKEVSPSAMSFVDLPKVLSRLDLIVSSEKDFEVLRMYFYSVSEGVDDVSSLPLVSLRLVMCYTPPSLSLISKSMPASLTFLDFEAFDAAEDSGPHASVDAISNQFLVHLPPKLTHLSLRNFLPDAHVTKNNIASALPRSLTHLSCHWGPRVCQTVLPYMPLGLKRLLIVNECSTKFRENMPILDVLPSFYQLSELKFDCIFSLKSVLEQDLFPRSLTSLDVGFADKLLDVLLLSQLPPLLTRLAGLSIERKGSPWTLKEYYTHEKWAQLLPRTLISFQIETKYSKISSAPQYIDLNEDETDTNGNGENIEHHMNSKEDDDGPPRPKRRMVLPHDPLSDATWWKGLGRCLKSITMRFSTFDTDHFSMLAQTCPLLEKLHFDLSAPLPPMPPPQAIISNLPKSLSYFEMRFGFRVSTNHEPIETKLFLELLPPNISELRIIDYSCGQNPFVPSSPLKGSKISLYVPPWLWIPEREERNEKNETENATSEPPEPS